MSHLSPQTLSEADRRLVAAWAADCVERVLEIFEAELPNNTCPRELINRTRKYALGELNTADEIRRRFTGNVDNDIKMSKVAIAVARAAGQAVAVCHMGAHALGAVAYAVEAVRLANPDQPEVADNEIHWQLDHMSPEVCLALQNLPLAGENSAGPLGPGLLTSGQMGIIIRKIQAGLSSN